MAVDLFSPESSSELVGPPWLRARRAAAAAALGEWDLPTTELEEWRYSRIRDLHPERFTLLGAAAEGAAAPGTSSSSCETSVTGTRQASLARGRQQTLRMLTAGLP